VIQHGAAGLGSTEAALLLGCSPRHVARLCQEGHLPAHKEHAAWQIGPEDVARFQRRPQGRPRTPQPSATVLRRGARNAPRRAQERQACAP
jgi:hypothetical protein